jgi:hypothetical protein
VPGGSMLDTQKMMPNILSGQCVWCNEVVTGVAVMSGKPLVRCGHRVHYFRPAKIVAVRFEQPEEEELIAA